MPRRYVITGAAGFIGSTLSRRLLAAGHRVTGVDSFDSFLYAEAPKRTNASSLAAQAGFKLVEGDIRSAATWREALSESADAVIHLAALAGVRPSLEAPELYFDVNVRGTVETVEACRRHDVEHLVFASSSSVYGDTGRLEPFREDETAGPLASPYAMSKRMAEQVCETAAGRGPPRVTALRFFTVYGPGQRPDMAFAKFVQRIRAGEPVELFGEGRLLRDYTFVDDVVEAIVAALERRMQPGQAAYRLYNVGGGSPTQLVDVVDLLGRLLELTPKKRLVPRPATDVPYTGADIGRIRRELGWEPRTTLAEGLRRYIDSLHAR